jgi:MHS family proline/betaine transporter-like MFS transporter
MVATVSSPQDFAYSPSQTRRIIVAASIGNALEWFDILVFGYFAVSISKVFFPAADETASLLYAFGTFGAAYVIRPLGAIVLGAYADRAGRKAALLVTIALMLIGTLLTAIMPPYGWIGIWAPLGMLVARLMQGFAIGGEFGSATAFLVEHGPTRKGFLASWQWSGQGLAAALVSAFGVVLTALLTPEQLQAWGWRVPFVFGLLVGPAGLYIRRHMQETPEFLGAEKAPTPVREVLLHQLDRLMLATGAVILSTSSNYLLVYMPTYAAKELGLPQSIGFIATTLGGLVLTVGSPMFGHWSDKVGRIRIMLAASALFLLTAYPTFLFLTVQRSMAAIILIVLWFSLLKTAYSGTLPALMAEIFPTKTRGTGMSLSYNIAVPLFGGLAPFYGELLIKATGDKLAPSFYLMLTSLMSLAVLLVVHRRFRIG